MNQRKPSEKDWIIAALVCRDVAELERAPCEHMTPDDMLVTGDELHPIVACALAAAREEGRQEERVRCVAICRDAPFHEGMWLAQAIERPAPKPAPHEPVSEIAKPPK